MPVEQLQQDLCRVCKSNSANSKGCGGLCLACWVLVEPAEALPEGKRAPHKAQTRAPKTLGERLQAADQQSPMSPATPAGCRKADWAARMGEARALEDAMASPMLGMSFSVSSAGWACSKCTFRNANTAKSCEICGTGKPTKEHGAPPPWKCTRCTVQNSGGREERCSVCSAWREWNCPSCTLLNRCPAAFCSVCGSQWQPLQHGSPQSLGSSWPPRRDRGQSFLDSLTSTQVQMLLDEDGDREKKVQRNRQIVEARIKKLKATVQEVDDDGNCLFRALSFQLWRTQRYHAQLRNLCVEWMRRHPQGFAEFVGEDFASYVDRIGKMGTWGDELSLRALSDALDITIHVVTSDAAHWHLVYRPGGGPGGSVKPLLPIPGSPEVFLAYISPVHYNSITPVEDEEATALYIEDKAEQELQKLRLVGDELARLEALPAGSIPDSAREELREKLDKGWVEVERHLAELQKVLPQAAQRVHRRQTFAAVRDQVSGPSSGKSQRGGASPQPSPPARGGTSDARMPPESAYKPSALPPAPAPGPRPGAASAAAKAAGAPAAPAPAAKAAVKQPPPSVAPLVAPGKR
eukprot:TRINITY_DN15699_c0_g1_i1.p1 TRINITY_DN15699_c0_g1~~TRINITY_DN15699_c0_g1_i1.p1  ORF type:complete len:578 (+),score=152.27 TRINITY_DN15699_c0_g1_i1:92-1825(+)